jgi:uncharacterized membrane protein YgdD (TMEM256/DUF423 family)
MAKSAIFFGSLFGFLSVALGAFAAHGLKASLSEYSLGIYQTAVQYQSLHAIALVTLGILAKSNSNPSPSRALDYTCLCWLIGILLFSGSLYALALTNIKPLGMITPFGGVAFLLGWAFLAVDSYKKI